MKIIGCFRKIGEEFVGSIGTWQHEADATIRPVKSKYAATSPDYVVYKTGSAKTDIELGCVWQRYSKRQRTSYLAVVLDDPTLSHPVHAVLWHADDDCWYLYWERASSEEHIVETLYVQEEAKPQIGIRPISRLTQNMIMFYPDLVVG